MQAGCVVRGQGGACRAVLDSGEEGNSTDRLRAECDKEEEVLMTREQEKELRPGLYRLYWREGGSSLVAVGILYDGRRWFAPTNWTSEMPGGVSSAAWGLVDRVERVDLDDEERADMRWVRGVVRIAVSGAMGRVAHSERVDALLARLGEEP